MKTSATQFELLVAFMEEHGDLNKPAANVKGRVHCIMLWEKLVKLLNSEGESKSLDKWKKVWSDLKNNTKRKVARIERESAQKDVPCNLRITELEQRVLSLADIKVTTEFVEVRESGSLDQAPTISSSPQTNSPEPPKHVPVLEESQPLESYTFTLLEPNAPDECGSTETWEQPGPYIANEDIHSSTLTHMSSQRQSRRNKRNLSKRLRDTISADVQSYLRSKSQWRKLKMEQHKEQIELEREKIRIRELEIQTQREWIGLGHRMVEVLGQFVNKFHR